MQERIEQVKHKLKENKDYRGQLYNAISVEGKNPHFFSEEDYPEAVRKPLVSILKKLELPSLYLHQGETIKSLWNGKNVFLCTNEGSGRSITTDIYSLIVTILKHGTVLYILPNIKDVAMRKENLTRRIAEAGWGWLLKSIAAMDVSELTKGIQDNPDIVITTPETIREYFLVQFTSGRHDIWFASLAFVVLEDINVYEPEDLVHLKNLIKALRLKLSTNVLPLNVLLTSAPVGSPERTAYSLLGREPEVKETEYCHKNSYHLLFWLPPLESTKEEYKDIEIKRSNYVQEISFAASIFCEQGGKYLVWHAFAALSSGELRDLRERAFEHKQISQELEIKFCHRLKEVEKNDYGSFNGVFILGFPPDSGRLKSLLGNLLKENGFALVIPPEEPLSYFIVRNPQKLDKMRLPELIVADFSTVTKHYLYRAIASLPQNRIPLSTLRKIWGGNVETYIKPLEEQEIVATEKEIVTVNDRHALIEAAGDFPWGCLERNRLLFSLTEADGRITSLQFNKSLFPWTIYRGAIFFHGLEKFQIPRDIYPSDNKLCSLSYAPEGAPVMVFPEIELKLNKEEKVSKISTQYGELQSVNLEVEEVFKGYRSFENYAHPGSNVEIEPHITCTRVTKGLKIPNLPSHGFEHIVKIFMPLLIQNPSKHVAITYHDNAIYIYSLYEENNEVIQYLRENWGAFIGKLFFNDGYQLLKTCPCFSGCPQCLNIFDCTDPLPDKSETLNALAGPVGKMREAEIEIQFKRNGLSGEIADEKYREWGDRILQIFRDKFEMVIKKKATLKGKDKIIIDGKSHSGSYSGDNVEVVYGLDEATAIEVIAHEYTHNWEWDEGSNIHPSLGNKEVPYEGKLISEGFAQWVSFKVMDFYGVIDNMKSISLWVDDEYGIGFKLLRWVEKNLTGFGGVIDFVRTGQAKDPDTGESYNLQQIIEKSDLRDKIKEAEPN